MTDQPLSALLKSLVADPAFIWRFKMSTPAKRLRVVVDRRKALGLALRSH
jgi:hypothetical protein